jgi:hypothetical protein
MRRHLRSLCVERENRETSEAEVPQITYDFTGGGHYGVEKEVRTKEQADQRFACKMGQRSSTRCKTIPACQFPALVWAVIFTILLVAAVAIFALVLIR